MNMMFYGHNKPMNKPMNKLETTTVTVTDTIIDTIRGQVYQGGAVIYDWGDGTTTTTTDNSDPTHEYTDGITEHTIVISCSELYNLRLDGSFSSVDISNNVNLESLDCTFCTFANIDISTNVNINYISIRYGSLETIDISNNPLITSLNVEFNNVSVDQVNSHLSALVSFGLSGERYWARDQNPAASPTGQGITDKSTLIADGWVVVTD